MKERKKENEEMLKVHILYKKYMGKKEEYMPWLIPVIVGSVFAVLAVIGNINNYMGYTDADKITTRTASESLWEKKALKIYQADIKSYSCEYRVKMLAEEMIASKETFSIVGGYFETMEKEQKVHMWIEYGNIILDPGMGMFPKSHYKQETYRKSYKDGVQV